MHRKKDILQGEVALIFQPSYCFLSHKIKLLRAFLFLPATHGVLINKRK